jgi:hypothetical protein
MRICWSPLRSSDRRSTTRSSLWSAPSDAPAACALAMGVDSKVLDLGRHLMDVRLRGFGSIEVEGRAYEHDIVIDRGAVRKRSKKPSKPYRDKFGHTPLSADEELPWGGPRLIIGTGAYGSLPIMPEVVAEAARRNTDLVAVPTEQACRLIVGLERREVRAVLHITC